MKLPHVIRLGICLLAAGINHGMEAMDIQCDAKGKCLIDQREYPAIGFGTYDLGEKCFSSMENAAKAGYQIIDTATFYNNFDAVGKALQQYGRENFYVISKVGPDSLTHDRLHADLASTLQQLQTTYLDAYLVHWPNSSVPIEETLQAMEELRKKNLIRHIGLSNVTVNHLKRALEVGVPIAWVQNEMNPQFYDAELLEFCQKHGIAFQAWAPLNRGSSSSDPYLTQLGNKYGKTAAQIALRWIIQNGSIPLPGSRNKEHIFQNFAILDFELNQREMDELNRKAKAGQRERVLLSDGFGFSDEFDFSYEECWPKRL